MLVAECIFALLFETLQKPNIQPSPTPPHADCLWSYCVHSAPQHETWCMKKKKKKSGWRRRAGQRNGMRLQLWPTSASWDFLIMQHTEKTDVSWWTQGRDLTVRLTPLAGLRSTADFMQLWWCGSRPLSNFTSLHVYILGFLFYFFYFIIN